MKKYLIINHFGIGDVLFTTPLIRALKNQDSQNRVGFWCNERVREILATNPRIDKVFPLSRGDLKRIYQESPLDGTRSFLSLARKIKKEKYDVSIDFTNDHRYSLIAKLIGIKKRIGFDYKKRGMFLTDKLHLDSYHKKHVVEYYLDLLKLLDIPENAGNLELFVSIHNQDRIDHILAFSGVRESDLLIGIAPGAGASWGKDAALKHWPPLKFAELADALCEKQKAKIVLLGSESEQPISEIIGAAMKHKPLDLVGKTSLGEFAAAIKRTRLFITNDGGPLHMAVALGVKTVSIFGPVDEKVYGPYPPSREHSVVTRDLACRPCYKNFKMPLCEQDRECLKSISVDEVYKAVRSLL